MLWAIHLISQTIEVIVFTYNRERNRQVNNFFSIDELGTQNWPLKIILHLKIISQIFFYFRIQSWNVRHSVWQVGRSDFHRGLRAQMYIEQYPVWNYVQVILWINAILCQVIQNMTKDCSLNYMFSTSILHQIVLNARKTPSNSVYLSNVMGFFV